MKVKRQLYDLALFLSGLLPLLRNFDAYEIYERNLTYPVQSNYAPLFTIDSPNVQLKTCLVHNQQP